MKYACLVFISIIFISCSTERYVELESGNKWRLLAFSDSDSRLDSAALFYLDFKVKTRNGNLLIEERNYPFEPVRDYLWGVLSGRYEGDSLEYISVSDDFIRSLTESRDTLSYLIRIDRIKTLSDLNDAKQIELAILDSIARSDLIRDNFSELQGMFININSSADTTRVLKGREVLIHYKGADLRGNVVDDSRRTGAPFSFVMGNEHQVIQGLELALYQMTAGDAATLIIPSWLAFGHRGSTAGIVPPYTTLIYTIEVLEVGS